MNRVSAISVNASVLAKKKNTDRYLDLLVGSSAPDLNGVPL
jgi:hypothetical protein